MATSLWELRKRPLPQDALASPTPTPATRPLTKGPPTTTAADAFSPCRYRRGICTRPRTLKNDGTLHSLCAIHRDRSIANQRRFDAKKRQLKWAESNAQDQQAGEKRKQRRDKRHHPTTGRSALPSFLAFQHNITTAPTVTYKREGTEAVPRLVRMVVDADADADATHAWLLPFEIEAAGAHVSDEAWRRDAVAQFLKDA